MKFNIRKRNAFIELIAQGNTIANTCEAMGIDTSTYRKTRLKNPEFAKEVDEAKQIRVHLVEDALFQSAILGNVLAQKFYLVNRSGGRWKEITWKVNRGDEEARKKPKDYTEEELDAMIEAAERKREEEERKSAT